MISISHVLCYYGSSFVMVARVKPGNKQHPGYDTRRESNGKIKSICLCCHGYNISSLTKPFNDIA